MDGSIPLRRIPVCSASLDGNELAYLKECIDSGWVSSSGPFVKRFESEFASWCGTKHAVTCTSGTAALHLALHALGVGPGDEVIVPSLTMIATGNAVLYCRATPVLVDVDPVDGNIDPEAVERAITARTKAVIVVHLYGLPCRMDAIREVCTRHGVAVVEDAAEAIGTRWNGENAGALSDAGCFSFFANKAITTGEGGMLVTNNPDIAWRSDRFKDQWFVPQRRFFHPELGYSYRMSNLQAAVGVAQLERVEALVEARCRVARTYQQLLGDLDELELPPNEHNGGVNSHWMMAVRLSSEAVRVLPRAPGAAADSTLRDDLMSFLKNRGIDTRSFFFPLDLQPVFRQWSAPCPTAMDLSCRGLLLPTGPTISKDELEFVAEQIRDFVRKGNRS